MKIAYPLLLVWLLLFSSPSFAAIVNGGFEDPTPFAGWSTAGLTSVETGAFGIAPTEGTNQARLHTGGGGERDTSATLSALATTLGVAETDITNFSPGAFNGSAISQAITVAKDDILNFDWNFVTSESTATKQDTAFFSLSRVGETPKFFFLADPVNAATPSAPLPYDKQTGYHTANPSVPLTFDFGGDYVLGFGVVNLDDQFGPSGLLIDNVRVTPSAVPEPTALACLGLVGVALTMRRRRRS